MTMAFCPNCGREIPVSSKFCPYCAFRLEGSSQSASVVGPSSSTSIGTQPESTEKREYLAFIPNVSSSDPAGIYEMYAAEHRLVLLKVQPRTSSWAVGGGLLGAAVTAGVDRLRKKTYNPTLSLDARVGLDKDNYVLPYGRILRIALSKGMFGQGKEIEVHYLDEEGKSKKLKYNFGKNSEAFGRVLSGVTVLRGKVDPSVPGYI